MSKFFAELKRRNVYKVAAAYAVVAWLVIQAASIVLPTLESPPLAMKLLLITLVIGFPVALVLSWAFEITSEGIKLESELGPNEEKTRHTGRRIVGITMALAEGLRSPPLCFGINRCGAREQGSCLARGPEGNGTYATRKRCR